MAKSSARIEAKLATPATEPQAPPSEGSWGGRRIPRTLNADALTPTNIKSLLAGAESGDLSAQAELFELMEERDGEMAAHLRTRKASVKAAPWTIEPADDSPAAKAAADYARGVVDAIPNLDDALLDLLDAVGKGYAIVEILWETNKAAWRPAQLAYRPQRWFTAADDGMTLLIKPDGFGDAEPMNPLNFIVHKVRAQSGFLYRTGLLRSCTRAFVLRMFSWKDWSAFAELFGIPPRIAYLADDVAWDSQEAAELWSMIRNMGTDMAAMTREGNRIDFPQIMTGTQPFERIIELAGRELTLSILGQTLTSGGEGGGSYALGQVHNQVRGDLTESDAKARDRTMTEQLLTPIVRLNKGPSAPIPHWCTNVAQPEDLDGKATRVKTLGEAGLRIPALWAYETFGIPEPEGDEEVLAPQGGGGFGMMSNQVGVAQCLPAEAGPSAVRAGGVHDRRRGNARSQPGAAGPHLYPPNEAEIFANEAEAAGLAGMDLYEFLNADPAPELSGPLPEDALSWLGEKRVVSPDAWDALSPAGKQRSWWVTGLSQQKTALVGRALMDVIRGGQGEFEFLDRLESLGLSVPGGQEPGAGQIAVWQARLVHRNNRFAAYHAQRWQSIERDAALRPYVQHVCGSEPCPICAPYCNLVMTIAEAAEIAGQLHHGCKCSQVSVSALDVEREGLDVIGALPDNPLMPDEFRYDRRDAYYLERDGGEPATDAGQADAALLRTQPRIADLLS